MDHDVELLVEASGKAVAGSLGLGPIDHADRSFQQRRLEHTGGTPEIDERRPAGAAVQIGEGGHWSLLPAVRQWSTNHSAASEATASSVPGSSKR